MNWTFWRQVEEREPHPNEMRDHLANSRTFLAWVRTAITIMAFGFVASKFSILLHELPGMNRHHFELRFSAIAGVVLVFLGCIFLILATVDFLITKRQIERQVIAFSAGLNLLLAGILIVASLTLGIYLWVTA